MVFFRMLWLRRLVRRYTSPVHESKANFWSRRLSIAYVIIAWNAVGIIALLVYNGKGDWAKTHGLLPTDPGTPAQQWSKTLGIKDATVYRVSGFNVKKYNIHDEFETNTPVHNDITNSNKIQE